jgi:hypothetical protein
MTTISASSTLGITLSVPAYANPVVVEQSVTVSNDGIGISAPTGFWTIQNSGSITGTFGVALSLGGYVNNVASASITGSIAGVLVTGATGTVVNTGLIFGSGGPGVLVLNEIGRVVNGGLISSGANAGVSMGEGSVSNQSSGTITSPGQGIGIAGPATVVNAGQIIGGTYGVHVGIGGAGTVANEGMIAGNGTTARGIYFQTGGYVTNAASASITSEFRAVERRRHGDRN